MGQELRMIIFVYQDIESKSYKFGKSKDFNLHKMHGVNLNPKYIDKITDIDACFNTILDTLIEKNNISNQ